MVKIILKDGGKEWMSWTKVIAGGGGGGEGSLFGFEWEGESEFRKGWRGWESRTATAAADRGVTSLSLAREKKGYLGEHGTEVERGEDRALKQMTRGCL